MYRVPIPVIAVSMELPGVCRLVEGVPTNTAAVANHSSIIIQLVNEACTCHIELCMHE